MKKSKKTKKDEIKEEKVEEKVEEVKKEEPVIYGELVGDEDAEESNK